MTMMTKHIASSMPSMEWVVLMLPILWHYGTTNLPRRRVWATNGWNMPCLLETVSWALRNKERFIPTRFSLMRKHFGRVRVLSSQIPIMVVIAILEVSWCAICRRHSAWKTILLPCKTMCAILTSKMRLLVFNSKVPTFPLLTSANISQAIPTK